MCTSVGLKQYVPFSRAGHTICVWHIAHGFVLSHIVRTSSPGSSCSTRKHHDMDCFRLGRNAEPRSILETPGRFPRIPTRSPGCVPHAIDCSGTTHRFSAPSHVVRSSDKPVSAEKYANPVLKWADEALLKGFSEKWDSEGSKRQDTGIATSSRRKPDISSLDRLPIDVLREQLEWGIRETQWFCTGNVWHFNGNII